MNPNFESVVSAALQLPPEQRKQLIDRLSENKTSVRKKNGDITKFFGTFHSDDPRSADNDKIDRDLAIAYMDNHAPEN